MGGKREKEDNARKDARGKDEIRTGGMDKKVKRTYIWSLKGYERQGKGKHVMEGS